MDYYHYADADNQPVGPLSAEQLHTLVRSGAVSSEAAVWKEGATEWHPYHSMFPPPVLQVPPVSPVPPSASGSGPRTPWYKRKGCQIPLFIFLPFVQVPLMWFWRLYSRSTRIKVTGTGCIWLLVILAMPSPVEMLKKDFAQNRTALLTQVKSADQAHDYQRVLALADRYSLVHDPELDNYLYTAHSAQKSAEEKARAERQAAKEREKADKQAVKQREQAQKDAADGPWVPRVRALNANNARQAGFNDGFEVVTSLVVKISYTANSTYAMRAKLAEAKAMALAAYDQLADEHNLDGQVYRAYREGWDEGFDRNASTVSVGR